MKELGILGIDDAIIVGILATITAVTTAWGQFQNFRSSVEERRKAEIDWKITRAILAEKEGAFQEPRQLVQGVSNQQLLLAAGIVTAAILLAR